MSTNFSDLLLLSSPAYNNSKQTQALPHACVMALEKWEGIRMKTNLSSGAVVGGGRISGLAPVVLPTRVGLGELMGTGLRCGIDLATRTNKNDQTTVMTK